VNDQTGQTTYTTQSTDNGALVAFNDASPIALTLNTSITAPWMTFITNLGVGAITATSAATIIGTSVIPTAGSAIIFYDGTSFWIFGVPGVTAVALAPGAAGNFTVAHGAGATPSAVVIEMKSSGAIWFQSTEYDATNLYLVASDGGLTASAKVIT
jgi:hypothetical protein